MNRFLLAAATAANAVVALTWAWRTVDLLRNIPSVPNLLAPDWPSDPALTEADRLAVIVPACNEEEAIAATLRSLLAQEGVPLEVVAVDDRSTDRTGAIMDALAAEAAQAGGPVALTVLHVRSLTPGWMGKQHALAAGVAATDAPYLLFTDGDIFYKPDALRRAMQFTVRERADHFVLLPTPIIQGIGEHMMISALQIYSAFAVRLWRIPDPARKDRLGVGAFNLVRREAYEAIGGFAALRMEVLEDVRLGVEIKRHGLRQRVAFGSGLVTVHWATGLTGVIRGVTKNFFAAVGYQSSRLLVGCIGLFFFGVGPVLGFLGPWPMKPASMVSLLSLLTLYRQFRWRGGSSPVYALLFPAATLCIMYAMLRSMMVTLVRGAVEWRGTRYPLAELRREAGPLF